MDEALAAQTLAWLDQEDRRITETIRRFGWAVEYVMEGDEEPSFAYTVGLFGLGHPELIVFGLDATSAGRVLNGMGDRVRANRDLLAGEVIELEGSRVRFAPLPHPERLLFSANRFYQRPDEASVPALQLIWDVEGAIPGDHE